jgi:hypothetical protein
LPADVVQAAAVARGKGDYPERFGQPECQVLNLVLRHLCLSVCIQVFDLSAIQVYMENAADVGCQAALS